MKYKNKILFNIISRNNESTINQSIKSILEQKNVRPYINIGCLNSTDKSFVFAKTYCQNPLTYEPTLVVTDNILISRIENEKSAIINGINFGASKNVEYYCFMHLPCILSRDYCEKTLALMDDEISAVFTDVIDSGLNIYSSLNNDNIINIGPCFIIKASFAKRFNNENIGDYLNSMVNQTIFGHIPKFLVNSDHISSLPKNIGADIVFTVDNYIKELGI